MLAKAVLLACLAEPAATADYTRAAALDLQRRGCYAEAGDHMSEVYRRAATPDERRAAATFVAGAYSEAFRHAPDQAAAAALLCRGLAIADDYIATAGAKATHMTTPRATLAALREPFGACTAVGELLPVAPQVRPQAPPMPTPVPQAVREPPPQAPPMWERRPGRAMMWTGAGVTLLGVGTVAAGLGLGLSRAAAAAEGADALTASAPGRGFTADEKLQLHELRGDLSSSMRGLGAGVGAGAALLVTGVVLTVIGVKRRGPQRAALVPWQRGVAVTLRF